ncbi:ABC transporter permease [Thermoactinospora rubra]|uniref:ABC transporter permease n=1 Tax=Thermoactinospora rubra TaxID=1088767 RepID=UPI000A0F7697|nr:ABC transporter permease [Thermoactinospora rubra]
MSDPGLSHPGLARLVLAHTKVQLTEQRRIPIALVASTFFPAVAMLAFVVPNVEGAVAATVATASMVLFATMSSAMMGLGIGVAADRELPWDPYLRTLPAGPFPRFAARILTFMVIALISVVPVVVIAWLFTDATITPVRMLLGVAALMATTVPFMLIGLFIGYLLPSKAAIAVSQLLFFPIAILGGLLGNPMDLPAFIDVVAPYMPSRGAVQLIWLATTDVPTQTLPIVMLGVWTVVMGLLAAWAYRRDEGRRFS